MEPVFLRNGRYAVHVSLWLRPLLGCFGEEAFKSRRSDIDENADWLIRIIFETVDRAAGGINGIAREQVGPGAVHKKTNPAFDDIEPFVFVIVVMRPGPQPGGVILRKAVNFSPVCLPSSSTTKRMQCTAFVGSDQERTVERRNGRVYFDIRRIHRRECSEGEATGGAVSKGNNRLAGGCAVYKIVELGSARKRLPFFPQTVGIFRDAFCQPVFQGEYPG